MAVTEYKMKVIIDRAKWNAGERYAEAALVVEMRERYDKCYCCLGFLGLACDIPEDAMVDRALPYDLKNLGDGDLWPSPLFEKSWAALGDGELVYSTATSKKADRWDSVFAAINDAGNIDDETREEWIRTGFDIIFNMDVEFVGEYGHIQVDLADADDEDDFDDSAGGYGY